MTLLLGVPKIPHFDLSRQQETLGSEIEGALARVIGTGRFILGSEVKNFESSFADYLGAKYAIGVGSGTDALIFVLRALNLRAGDEVIVPAFTFVGTVFAILHAGARPVLADVDPNSFTLDATCAKKVMTRRSRVLLPVHLYGHTGNMGPLIDLARKRKLKIVEDACQAHGAAWKQKKAGTLGEAGCFSFYPTKNLGAFGDGGLVVTNSMTLAKRVSQMRNAGRDARGRHQELGWASRLDSLQAAILSLKLNYLESFIQKRRVLATRYHRQLRATPLQLPEEAPGAYHVYHLYAVRVPEGRRDALASHLAKKGIGTAIHYPQPVHRQPFYRSLFTGRARFPVAEKVSREILSLPLYPELKEEEVDRVTEAVRQFYA